jgi:hypothetical protein
MVDKEPLGLGDFRNHIPLKHRNLASFSSTKFVTKAREDGKEGIESSVGGVGAASCLYWALLPNNHLPQRKKK